MTTEIILKKDVVGLGEEGDIKKVAGGYARNYLLPFGYAVLKNNNNLKKLEQEREAIESRKAKKLDESKSVVEKVDNLEIELLVNASKGGKLFGSISQLDIVNAIKEKGTEVDKKQVILTKPIKNTGTYTVNVKFYGNLNATVKVKVIDKDATAEEEIKEEVKTEEVTENVEEQKAEVEETAENSVDEESSEEKEENGE